ncbi:hypothetical protein DFP98_10395 [Cohnella phaseoli]|uniref:Uncharacterized protein n=1 Tax=Cohnella phaseoli TaxID=456490 RepID=A0A3D9KJ91_9BACL|nr:hypothetical protein DFP98_10395 [Cohnella phaseoli]
MMVFISGQKEYNSLIVKIFALKDEENHVES